MTPLLLTIFQAAFLLIIAPLSIGITRKTKAFFQGRQGASIFLPYVTIATLMKKEMVISKSTSWVFRMVPFIVLSTTVFLALVLPLVTTGGVLSPLSHFILVAAVLALGSIFLVFGGLESASAFGGMGAAREMTIAALVEPTIITIFATLAVATGATTIDGMMAGSGNLIIAHPYLILTAIALLLVTLAENARYPVDNPATHLELTMVHEAMVLEYSGPYLAMLEYASALKLTIFGLLFSNLFSPVLFSGVDGNLVALAVVCGLSLLKFFGAMIGIALLESTIAKMRFYRLQEYFTGSFFIALGGLILAVFL